MKKLKKLIPALAMLLVSAVMLGTSTFAWFSMNKEVSASNMKVTATSNTQYFVIAKDLSEGAFPSDATNTSVAMTASENKVSPVSYTTTKIIKDDNNTGLVVAANKWYTASSNKYDQATGKIHVTNNDVTLESGNYFIGYTFYVGLAANSDDYTGKITVSAVKENSTSYAKAAVKITGYCADSTSGSFAEATKLITHDVTSSGVQTTDYYQLSVAKTTTTTVAAKYLKVEVFVYIDGNDENVKDSATSLTDTITITIEGE